MRRTLKSSDRYVLETYTPLSKNISKTVIITLIPRIYSPFRRNIFQSPQLTFEVTQGLQFLGFAELPCQGYLHTVFYRQSHGGVCAQERSVRHPRQRFRLHHDERSPLPLSPSSSVNTLTFLTEWKPSNYKPNNPSNYFNLSHLTPPYSGRISGNTISTVIIDREKISSSLDLPLSLFPLLSCLLGNDVVNYEVLEEFHKRLLADTGTWVTVWSHCGHSGPQWIKCNLVVM